MDTDGSDANKKGLIWLAIFSYFMKGEDERYRIFGCKRVASS